MMRCSRQIKERTSIYGKDYTNLNDWLKDTENADESKCREVLELCGKEEDVENCVRTTYPEN